MTNPPSTSPAAGSADTALGGFTREAFEAHLGALSSWPAPDTAPASAPASAPAWWLERKRAAYEAFASLPMPCRTDESWRFSSLGSLGLAGFGPASASAAACGGPDAPAGSHSASLATLLRPCASLCFVDGRHSGGLALPAELAAKGIVVTTLREALLRHSDLLREHFMAQPQKLGSAKFAALHTAFIEDGAFIRIPRGVVLDQPIAIVHASTGTGGAVFPHTLVIAEENSRVAIVDQFVSSGSGPQLACGANDLYAGHGAQITYAAAQGWSPETLSFQLNSTVVRRDARVQSLNLHLGARQARHESLSQLQAPGAFSEMLALTVAGGEQEFDQRTLQIHQAPNTKSDLLYKNALLDRARTIFSGLIVVDPDAQGTDAYQSNRNLMLSDDAEANSLPGLEIQANDVRRTHGATSSRIDAEQGFYLKSRGIPQDMAEKLLVFGFFEEVLNRLQDDQIHAALRSLVERRFGT
jgi:Fe-S cluster assembly protein SufD